MGLELEWIAGERQFFVFPAFILYVGCMLFATFDLWAANDEVKMAYKTVRGHIIPAMIFVMLLRCDIRKILRLGPRMLLGFFSATFTIMAGFAVMFYFMKDGLLYR